jgi:hypothetical protein
VELGRARNQLMALLSRALAPQFDFSGCHRAGFRMSYLQEMAFRHGRGCLNSLRLKALPVLAGALALLLLLRGVV